MCIFVGNDLDANRKNSQFTNLFVSQASSLILRTGLSYNDLIQTGKSQKLWGGLPLHSIHIPIENVSQLL